MNKIKFKLEFEIIRQHPNAPKMYEAKNKETGLRFWICEKELNQFSGQIICWSNDVKY